MPSSSSSTSSSADRSYSLGALCEAVGGVVQGDTGQFVRGVANPEDATEDDLIFVVEAKYREKATHSRAGAFVGPHGLELPGKAAIWVGDPRVAMARILALFAPPSPPPGVSEHAIVAPGVRLGRDVAVGAGCVLEPGVQIGDGTVLSANVTLMRDVRVGAGCLLYPQVVVREQCVLGDRVIVQPGAVIGADGYGFVRLADKRHLKMPQLGNVVIEDDVEIGANVAIDRATLGSTRIGRGTKVDNLVHVGHNDHIGEDCLLVSQVGISGSVMVGNRTTLAGQVGVAGHLRIGDDCLVLARTGVTKDIPDGSTASGFPSRPHREELRRMAAIARAAERLPELMGEVERLSRSLDALSARLNAPTGGRP